MGRQIGFYMTDDDEPEFLEFLRTTGDVCILPNVAANSGLESVGTFQEIRNEPNVNFCVLWNRSLSPEPEFRSVQTGRYVIDQLQSEVIDIILSDRPPGNIDLGRLFIERTCKTPEGEIVYKSKEFLSWYDRVSRWIRKNYHYNKLLGAYVSPRAEEEALNGVKLRY